MDPSDSSPSPRRSAARDRLLSTASQVFYDQGMNAVSVERVIEEAGVTRSTFYRHFQGKDHLIAACLADRDEKIRAACAGAAEQVEDPAELLRLIMRAIGDEVCGPGFRGCPFINAVAEFPDPESVVHRAATTHRSWFRALVVDLVRRAGVTRPAEAAQTLVMLRDGAMIGGYLEDATATRKALVDAVDTVLSMPR
jgi:AcrR family transcriptional regulator